MKFWPKRLTALPLVCGVLTLLIFGRGLQAYQLSKPRPMGRFENGKLALTVEELPDPALGFAGHFVFGEALSFYYRFTLSQGKVVCSSFTISGESSCFKRAEVLKHDAGAKEKEKSLFVCVLDGALRVACSGSIFHRVQWNSGWIRDDYSAKAEAGSEEPPTFLAK